VREGVDGMNQPRTAEDLDLDVRHFVYTTFAHTARPPTTLDTAAHFCMPIAAAEAAFERLANAHHIALAPGTHAIWMAHPFSGLPTNYVTRVDKKAYWGN
jgi:hypothetical protein